MRTELRHRLCYSVSDATQPAQDGRAELEKCGAGEENPLLFSLPFTARGLKPTLYHSFVLAEAGLF